MCVCRRCKNDDTVVEGNRIYVVYFLLTISSADENLRTNETIDTSIAFVFHYVLGICRLSHAYM